MRPEEVEVRASTNRGGSAAIIKGKKYTTLDTNRRTSKIKELDQAAINKGKKYTTEDTSLLNFDTRRNACVRAGSTRRPASSRRRASSQHHAQAGIIAGSDEQNSRAVDMLDPLTKSLCGGMPRKKASRASAAIVGDSYANG